MFIFSKLFQAITQPVFWLALWWGVALLLHKRRPKAAQRMGWLGLLCLGVLGYQPLPNALLRSLESQYTVPNAQVLAQQQGVIVLGGGTEDAAIYVSRQQVPLGAAAERLTTAAALMRQHPDWQWVFTGGSGRLLGDLRSEADLARVFWLEQGANVSRLRLEDRSRNTRENARFVAEMLGAECQKPWLLVTSAWHMPRAMAEFEAVGCRVTAYPTDFRTSRESHWGANQYALAGSLMSWQIALHEYLGLFVYRWTR